MGLLDIFSGKKPSETKTLSAIEEDREWVNKWFKWLISRFGHPAYGKGPYFFDKNSFPVTFKAKQITVDNLLDDICRLVYVDRRKVTYELIKDIRDIPMTPYEIYGKSFISDLEIIKNDGKVNYKISIANSVTYTEHMLLHRLLLEVAKIKLAEKKLDSVEGKNMAYVSYLLCVFLGLGVLVSKALVEVRVSYVAGWRRRWADKSDVPYQVVAYALALYAKMTYADTSQWSKELPPDVNEEFEAALNYLTVHPEEGLLADKEKVDTANKARGHYELAVSLSKAKKYNEAIKEYEQVIALINNKDTLATVYVNMAYAYLKLNNYSQSLVYYDKCLFLKPDNPYALNNSGYIYIVTGELEKAKDSLSKVVPQNKILEAYLYRNWALCYWKGLYDTMAEECFKKALDTKTPVDLLEYYYAQYLLTKGEKDEAVSYLIISANKGEQEGIDLMKTL